MIPRSPCRHWQYDKGGQPAQDHRSYTTPGDTTHAAFWPRPIVLCACRGGRAQNGRLTLGVYASLSTGNMFASVLEHHRR